MKIRRIIVIVALLIVVAALVSMALISHWQHSEQSFKILPKLAVAEQSYVRDRVSHGQPLPTSVTLQDLVSGGYISADTVRSLAGADVTFYPMVGYARWFGDNSPQPAIWVRVRMPDGVQIVAMADGSVQQLPR